MSVAAALVFLSFLILFFVIDSTYSSIIFVSTLNGNDSSTCGASVATACQSLQFTLEQRVADNDTVELSAGESFPIKSAIHVSTRNLTLRSANADRRALIFCNNASMSEAGPIPMISFNASLESFQLENVDFRSMVSGPVALFFNVSETTFSLLRLENASFVDFLWSGPKMVLFDAYGVVSLRCPDGATLLPNRTRHRLEIVIRDVRFENNSDWPSDTNQDTDTIHNAIGSDSTGAQIDLALGSNPNTTHAVTIERVLLRNCSSQALSATISVRYGQQNSTILFHSVAVLRCRTTWAPGVEIIRTPFATAPANVGRILFRNCTFRNNGASAGNTTLQATVRLVVVGITDVTVSQTAFQSNSRDAKVLGAGAQAFSILTGAFSYMPQNATKSALVLLVNSSAFVSDQVLLGSGLLIKYGAWSTGSNVTIQTSQFSNFAACGDCIGAVANGGAIRFGPNDDAISNCAVHREDWLRIDDCSFVGNSAARGGAIAVETSCRTGQIDMKVLRSAFIANSALSNSEGDGGAILFEQAVTGDYFDDMLTIDDCIFMSNKATKSGGAIAVGGCARGQFNIALRLAVVMNGSRFTGNSAAIDGQVSVTFAKTTQISNTFMLQTDANALVQQVTLSARRIDTSGPLVVITNSSFQCGPGQHTQITNSSTANQVSREMTALVTMTCVTCSSATYNLFTEVLQFNESSALQPSTFQCHACPLGSRYNCTGADVGSSPGFWGAPPLEPNASTLVDLHQCPNKYCCDEIDGCKEIHRCTNNRMGAMCGKCRSGFVQAFAPHGACVPADVCSSTRVWTGNSLVFLAASALVLYAFRRASATTDGMFGVLVSFVNVAQVVIGNTVASHTHLSSNNAFNSAMHAVFSLFSGLIEPDTAALTYCPLESMTSFQKIVMPLSLPALLVGLWAIVSCVAALLAQCRQRRHAPLLTVDDDDDDDNDDADADTEHNRIRIRRQLLYRVFTSLATLLDFSLFIVVGVSVSLMHNVYIEHASDLKTPCRLWTAGDVECSASITASGALLLSGAIATPVALHLWQRFRPESVLSVAVADVYQSAMSPNAKHYGFAIMARRALVAIANSFLSDVDLRLVTIRTVLLVALATRLFVWRPFLSKWVNWPEASSLLLLLGVTLLQWEPTATTRPSIQSLARVAQSILLTVASASVIMCATVTKAGAAWQFVRNRWMTMVSLVSKYSLQNVNGDRDDGGDHNDDESRKS